MYKSKHPLFRNLTDNEEREFREYTFKFCIKGFSVNQLDTIHPVIRKELIDILETSLRKQGEL